MSSHNVTKILGVGAKTAAVLAEHGVNTVGQLADLDAGQVPVNGLSTLIGRAKIYLQNMVETGDTTNVVLGDPPPMFPTSMTTKLTKKSPNNSKDVAIEPELKSNDNIPKTEEEELKYLITDHSWWEMKVLIPRMLAGEHEFQSEMKEAIIYELSIDPDNRIAFVCSWIVDVEQEKREKLCSMTYSPSFIYYFNLDLPPLAISLRQADLDKLQNKNVLQNVLLETNFMIRSRLMQ